ncbi:rRNA maturation RNase YbeY [Magnetospira sp. QH-2]|uniref:rRNA maturation RNase YbeY n=1 Tax=Magnetospira sp. (strain QH-2) TaxID=1288970 RepID=UPI0003E8101F|nr:rRNA maturation RNase YbeY [Magnetospira sp. QH-2]CCQ75710.1 conserved hypothetical protein, similar to putative metal-dependent hydrolase [Magnetospira sp. QH-2]
MSENPLVDLTIAVNCADWTTALPDAKALGRRAALAVLGRPTEPVEASLVLADDETVRGLNLDYRGRDAPTNVLSFADLDAGQAGKGPKMLGDVIIALETTVREAKEQQKSFADHFSHLVVHGMLHLLGFDHEDNEEADVMERLETELLAGLGIMDPYASSGAQDGNGRMDQ